MQVPLTARLEYQLGRTLAARMGTGELSAWSDEDAPEPLNRQAETLLVAQARREALSAARRKVR